MLKEMKLLFEKVFYDNWTETPIHYGGQEFKNDGIDEWVNLVVSPLSSRNADISDGGSVTRTHVYIVCWAENDFKCSDLADKVTAFMSENVQHRTNGYTIIDHGYHEDNSVFIVIQYLYEIRGCVEQPIAETPPCLTSVGGLTGGEYSLGGIWEKDCIIFKKDI